MQIKLYMCLLEEKEMMDNSNQEIKVVGMEVVMVNGTITIMNLWQAVEVVHLFKPL